MNLFLLHMVSITLASQSKEARIARKWISIQIFSYGTIHILRNHIFRIFGPPPPLRNHVFSTENNQKLAFSDPPSPPTSDYVIYEWSLW